ncbi:MAG: hypothetical protein ACSW8G_00850 [Bacillota bacterium]
MALELLIFRRKRRAFGLSSFGMGIKIGYNEQEQGEIAMRLIDTVLFNKNLPDEDFIRKCGLEPEDLPGQIADLFDAAAEKKDADDIEACITLMYRFHCVSDRLTGIMESLITEDWHISHEDMASYLDIAAQPSSTGALYAAANMKFDYLDYDDSHGLASKSIWALGKIGNEYAVGKLELLAKSEDDVIAKDARRQLERITAKEEK